MQPGTQIGPYTVDSLLGEGGMAQVWKVHHSGLGRLEALKSLLIQLRHDRDFVQRFLNEARTAAKLEHPNIVVIHSVSALDDPQPYFVMEFVDGGDLADLLHQRRLPLAEAVGILRQIADALDYAHSRGVIHRDVKPANIMLTRAGRIKVVDFGIARAVEDDKNKTRLTRAGMLVGTPEYMSPEQAGSGAEVDRYGDQYSLGIIAYEMLCGKTPFSVADGLTTLNILMAQVSTPPRPPVEMVSGLPKGANDALLRALAKNPAERFRSCSAFVEALGDGGVLNSTEILDRPTPKLRRPWVEMGIGAALLGGMTLVGLGLVNSRGGGVTATPTPEVKMPPTSLPDSTPIPITPTLRPIAPVKKMVVVPDLSGMKERQARDFLKLKSLRADISTGESDSTEAGLVARQSPASGARLTEGSPVHIVISTGGAADTPAPEPEQQAPSAGDIRHVRALYSQWLDAWQSREIDTFMAFYSRDVVQKRAGHPSHGYSAQRDRLTTLWDKVSYVTISSGDPDISVDGDQIVLTAQQRYDDSIYWDTGVKHLVWEQEGDEWKIIEESFDRQAGGNK